LQAEIEGLKAQLALMRDQLDDVKGQRDSWQKQAENSQRILQDMRPRRGLFGFLKAG
jgi:predicted  nucleic acid-binding Zn-ribbon protein